MSIYKAFDGKKGVRYLKDKKFVSAKNIPAGILSQLKPGEELDDQGIFQEVANKSCVFCGSENCKMTRMIDTKIVYLCQDHYYSTNIGQIAQRLKVLQEA